MKGEHAKNVAIQKQTIRITKTRTGQEMKERVMVALSGGVDSAVAAYLLKEEGYEVVGVTMCLGVKTPESGKVKCCGVREIEDARGVCSCLGISHNVIDFAPELARFVIEPFIEEYRTGRTPNPCVECNRRIKFGALLELALSMGFDLLATGHYALVDKSGGICCLKVAKDSRKDQTYFLSGIPKEALKHVVFPLADLTKDQVRAVAKSAKLPVSSKPDSQDICFIPAGGVGEFLKKSIDEVPGDIVNRKGKIMGRHRGIPFYTIGQRTGLGISAGRPQYVLSLDAAQNRIIVGDRRFLSAQGLVADCLNLFIDDLGEKAFGKIRYAHTPAPCTVTLGKGEMKVLFDEPQEAITPGQTIVLYDNGMVLASGIIKSVIKQDYANTKEDDQSSSRNG
jgi:tRNA-specific 2-thiouridylase